MLSSHTSTVSFDGNAIGSLLQVTFDSGSASTTDCTSFDSTLVGSGATSRIRKFNDCSVIEPGGVTLRILGATEFTDDDIGSVGSLSFTTGGNTYTAEAIIGQFTVEASVGELIRSGVSFVFTGN